MTTRKQQAKSVSDMAVLKDIRGLLSGKTTPTPTPPGPAHSDPALEKRVKELEALVEKQKADMAKLEADRARLEAEAADLRRQLGQKPAPGPRADDEVLDLEARKAELTAALEDVEALLRIKVNDLARRIARVYQEAGDMDAGRDFRRLTGLLDASEAFGEFVRALRGNT